MRGKTAKKRKIIIFAITPAMFLLMEEYFPLNIFVVFESTAICRINITIAIIKHTTKFDCSIKIPSIFPIARNSYGNKI